MNNDNTKKPFDPKTARALTIVAAQNGWLIYHQSEDSLCSPMPRYVFNSPAELANAVANLVQFGSIEKPAATEPENFCCGQAVESEKPRVKYHHTLDGWPASFSGKQICWGLDGGYAGSLEQIAEQQIASMHWRKERGFAPTKWAMGYAEVPA